jgi:hypothetical protein
MSDLNQAVRPFVSPSVAPGQATPVAATQPEVVRIHIGRNATLKCLNGSLSIDEEYYQQDVASEVVPPNGWPF